MPLRAYCRFITLSDHIHTPLSTTVYHSAWFSFTTVFKGAVWFKCAVKIMLNQRKQYRPVCREWHGAPFLCFLAVWSRFKALAAGSFVLMMLLQLKSAWEPPHANPLPSFSTSSSAPFSLLLLSIPFLPPLHPPAAPPPPASLLFLSSTHVRLSTTEWLKIASGIPASIQIEEGGTSGHKPPLPALFLICHSSHQRFFFRETHTD